MSVKLGVDVDVNTASADTEIDRLHQRLSVMGSDIAKANKVPFTPISRDAVKSAEDINNQFKIMIRLSADFRKRMKETSQQNRGFFDVDWDKLYPNKVIRDRKRAEAFQYVTGQSLGGGGGNSSPPVPPSHPPSPPSSGGGASSPANIAANAARAGLNAASGATGGVGGVAANALGTGMSKGFGAGVAGLFGGVLALGVGKMVGAVADRMTQAEDNAVAFDKLKRVLGDVGISFTGLKANVMATSDSIGLTFSETAKLATQYAKTGNLSNPDDLTAGLKTSVGFSRAFGLDPSEGVSAFGGLRGANINKNELETKKFALLIGETIGKSGAFAKADEVMDALATYTTNQARNTLGVGNAAGYGGALAGLIHSGMAGLDVTGASNILSRANSSIMSGGAMGEGSQFFSNMLGQHMGLNPFQAQMMREGGAFATKNSTFGDDSIYQRFMGGSGKQPTGSETMLAATLRELRHSYGGGTSDLSKMSAQSKGYLAQATANHLGMNISQAMALHTINPMVIGGMQKYANIQGLTGSGIANLSTALHGSAGQRRDLASNLYGRTGKDRLSDSDRIELKSVMAGGDESKQKDLLARLVASRDQESTQGSDIRDSKNILDNLKTGIADKLIPYTQDIRFGIMKLAGVGKDGSFDSIIEEMMRGVAEGNIKRIEDEIDPQLKSLDVQKSQKGHALSMSKVFRQYNETAAGNEAKKNQEKVTANLEAEYASILSKINALKKEKKDRIEEENLRLANELSAKRASDAALRKAESDRLGAEKAAVIEEFSKRQQGYLDNDSYTGMGSRSWATGNNKADSIFNRLIMQESSGSQFNLKTGLPLESGAGAIGVGQLLPSTAQEAAKRDGIAWDDTKYRYDKDYNKRLARSEFDYNLKYYKNDIRKAVGAYHSGRGGVDKAVKNAKNGDWVSQLGPNGQNYVHSVYDKAEGGTPIPQTPTGSGGGNDPTRIIFDPIVVMLKDAKGNLIHKQEVSPLVPNNWKR